MRLSECPLWDSARFVFRMSLGRSFTLAVTFFGCTYLHPSWEYIHSRILKATLSFIQGNIPGMAYNPRGAAANKAGKSVAIPNKEGKLADAQMTCTIGT